MGKHVLISVPNSSSLIQESLFLCNADPNHLVSSFTAALHELATQSKTQTKKKFIEVLTVIKTKPSVWYTGTIEAKAQPSQQSVGYCRRF